MTLDITYPGQRLATQVTCPAFFPFPLPFPRSRSTCGWRGVFKLHLVGTHLGTHIVGNLLAFPICSTPFVWCCIEQGFIWRGVVVLAACGGAELLVVRIVCVMVRREH